VKGQFGNEMVFGQISNQNQIKTIYIK